MPVGPLDRLFRHLLDLGCGGPVLLGVDLPIGLPRAYAARAGIEDFRQGLVAFGHGHWRCFYEPAADPNQIRLVRPFYPRTGRRGVRQDDLVRGLSLESPAELRRRCDWPTIRRPGAARLFWTLGAQQVGKAAITGWRDLLAPAVRRRDPVRLWPFDGPLAELLQGPVVTVAEAYPAELYHRIGVGRGRWSKRRPADRRAHGPALIEAAGGLGAALDGRLVEMIETGFGERADGEDRFDAVAGVLGLLDVLKAGICEPAEPTVRRIEGWILGLDPAEIREPGQ